MYNKGPSVGCRASALVSRRAIRIVGIVCLALMVLGVAGGGGGLFFVLLEQQPHQSTTTSQAAVAANGTANATTTAAVPWGFAAFWARLEGLFFPSPSSFGSGKRGRRQREDSDAMGLVLAEERGRQAALVERAMQGGGDGRITSSPPPLLTSSVPPSAGGDVVSAPTAPSPSTAPSEALAPGCSAAAHRHQHYDQVLLGWLCAPTSSGRSLGARGGEGDVTSARGAKEEGMGGTTPKGAQLKRIAKREQRERGVARLSYGTLAALPPTVSVKGYVAKVGRMTLCNSSTDPLRVTILLAAEEEREKGAEEKGDAGGSSSFSSSLLSSPLGLMATQLKALTGPRNTTESDDFLNAALVTVIIAPSSPFSMSTTTLAGDAGEQLSLVVAVVHYASNASGAVLLEPTVISIPSSLTDSTAGTAASLASNVIGGRIAAVIGKQMPNAAGDGVTAEESSRSSRRRSGKNAAANNNSLLSVVVPLLRRPAHFVYSLPPSAVMSTANIAALCIQDPMLNDESEAKAYYPYHDHHNRRGNGRHEEGPKDHDAGWRDERDDAEKAEAKERLPLAFVHVPSPSSSSSSFAHRGATEGEKADGDDADADGYPSLINLVTSCRPPILIRRPTINSQHYTKGGDVVLRGLGRYAGISVPPPTAGSFPSPSPPADGAISGTAANANTGGATNKVYVNFLMGVNVETILTTIEGDEGEGKGKGKGRRRALPNYTIPLFSPLSFNATSPIPTVAVHHPESIFRMRRPLGNMCSDSPIENPTRVVSMIPFYLDGLMDWKKSRSVFVRACQAAAAMARHSDLIVLTNVPAMEFRQVMRRGVRQMMAGQSQQQQKKADGRPRPPPLPPPDPAVFMDTRYPSELGEFVLIHLDMVKAQIPRIINGMVEFQIMAAKGFYDVVRYSEEDVYITRDQFNFFCATLPWMEANDYYLNFMRFEFNSTKMEKRLSLPASSAYDVRRAYAPMNSVYIDSIRFGWSPLFPPALKWDFPNPPMGLTLSLKAAAAPPPPSAHAEGEVQSLSSLSSSSSATPTTANGLTDLYTVEAVGTDTCFSPRYYNPLLIQATYSDESLSPNRPAGQYGPLMLPTAAAVGGGGGGAERKAPSSASAPSSSFQQPTSEDDISGCYVLSSPRQLFFDKPRIYNAMYMVPDHRLERLYTDGGLRYIHRKYKDRESIAHFRSPVQSYKGGLMAFHAYSGAVVVGGGGLNTTQGESGVTSKGDKGQQQQQQRTYFHSRLTSINHGGNTFHKDKGGVFTPNIFLLTKRPRD